MVYAVLNNGNGGRVDITEKLGRFGGVYKKAGICLNKNISLLFCVLTFFYVILLIV